MGLPTSVAWAIRIVLIAFICRQAYVIRLHALEEYGMVIHEFDPWFNYRATEYLKDNGLEAFFKWYDYKVWYPLGRPVGTTIYPGMQMTSVAIWNGLQYMGYDMSLNDVCCYVPAWFGVSATIFLGLLAYETTGSANTAIAAAFIMSIIPAHLMRSVGGGYDNESIAMTAMVMTFYFWCRALRNNGSAWIGLIAGVAYIYMAAAWGGYVFVLNMVGLSAAVIAALNTLSQRPIFKLWLAYSLFYVIGTYGAMQVPVIGWTPLKSLEQLGPFFVFLGIQLLYVCDRIRIAQQLDAKAAWILRFKLAGGALVVLVLGIVFVVPSGYFGPLSSRIRGLFVQHTRTGNPLVDSVAEHQPASARAYYQYLHNVYMLYPFGFGILCYQRPRESSIFLILYAMVAYYFSAKMTRLILLLGPIASCLGAIMVIRSYSWISAQLTTSYGWYFGEDEKPKKQENQPAAQSKKGGKKGKKAKAEKRRQKAQRTRGSAFDELRRQLGEVYNDESSRLPRTMAAGLGALFLTQTFYSFYSYSWQMSPRLSHPSLMYKAQYGGQVIMVDDYREAYWWLRDNTPEDSRVMAWWDYGYQITGIAERTTIADGNTWNHEHIATLGRCMVSPVKEAHKIVRHLADYVLIWTGGGGDDLAKSPHMARISNSVYNFICPDDPTCSQFGFENNDRSKPTKMMKKSLIYQMHQHGQNGVNLDPELFREVFSSKFGKVRIFKVRKRSKKSIEWAADPANKECDAGGWYCPGNYPPALDFVFEQKKDFQQLEDFNVKKDKDHEEYQKKYMEKMNQRGVPVGAG